ncbi:hypothetical protein TNCV_2096391 [Trichonephila clavipes]|nr:hypothetical protein TNCV_2096391 [Trichonephila clavipes]
MTNESNPDLAHIRPLEVKIAAPHYPLNAGSRKQIICETTGSRPRALLSWWLDGKKIGAGTTDTVSDGGNLTVSTLHLVPTPNDDGKILSCRAENPAVPNSAIEDEWTIRVHCNRKTKDEVCVFWAAGIWLSTLENPALPAAAFLLLTKFTGRLLHLRLENPVNSVERAEELTLQIIECKIASL